MNADAIILPHWPAPPAVKSAITTRRGGVSRPPWGSFNLGDHVGDNAAHVRENRNRLSRALDLAQPPAWLQQVHGVDVVELRQCPVAMAPRADAVWTSTPGCVCAIMTADCLPVLFCDRAGTRVGAAHAGWRGLSAGVLGNIIRAMGIAPEHLMAYLGPAIGPSRFEVGGEVRETFIRHALSEIHRGEIEACFEPQPSAKWLADIYGLAQAELRYWGVVDIFGGDRCTFDEDDVFFSFRRDGVTGRMASLIWLESTARACSH
jgi:purine-nucleoside/S-methyl-5'-thioadenosine phosphorylase / adenosine deaminase